MVPARPATYIGWNRFLDSIKVKTTRDLFKTVSMKTVEDADRKVLRLN